MLTGKINNITVIDVDGDFEWYEKFMKEHKLPQTTTVRSGSGGLHYYYKYDKRVNTNTDGWNNGRFGEDQVIKVDCRNNGGVCIYPGSVY